MKVKTDTGRLNELSANQRTLSLEGFPAFTPVLAECVHFLNRLPAVRTIPAGAVLVEQGCPASTIHLIENGLVKLIHLSANGHESTIGLRSEGWYAGYASAFLRTASVYSVRAVTPCRVVRIPADDFASYLSQVPAMLRHFLSVLCAEVATQASLQVEVMSSSAEDRLEHFMRERTDRHPTRKVMDPLPALKQMELAQLLAVTPEHLSRMMKKKMTGLHRERVASG